MSGIAAQIELNDKMSATLERIDRHLNKLTSALTKFESAADKAFNAELTNTLERGFDRVVTAIYRVCASVDDIDDRVMRLDNHFDMVNNSINNVTTAVNKTSSTQQKLTQTVNETKKAIDKTTRSQQRFNNKTKEGIGIASKLGNAIKVGLGTYLSVRSIGQLVNVADELTMTTARLNLMNDGLKTTAELSDQIYQSAMRSRSGYLETADAVAKLRLRAGQIFKTNDEAVAFSETLNKMFVIAGTSTQEMYSATLQLTQALGSGVLRGEEFRAVFEAAPNVMQAIADYMDLPIGKLRELSNEGTITADIVKNALFAATKKVDKQFKTIPMTWQQVWISVKNYTIKLLEPMLVQIREITSSERFQKFGNTVGQVMGVVAGVVTNIFDKIVKLGAFIYDNWALVAPIVWGVVTALTAYIAKINLVWFWTKVMAGAKIIWGAITSVITLAQIALWSFTNAQRAATAATLAFNAAWLANPITWIILGIVVVLALVIGAIMKVCEAFSTFGKLVDAVCGFILGTIAWAVATVWNIFVGLWNGILQMIDSVVNAVIGVIEWVLNACLGGFNSLAGACANLIGQIIGWFLSLGKVVTRIIDAIFGTNWTAGLESLRKSVTAWGANDKKITLERNVVTNTLGLKRTSATDWYNKAYTAGSGVSETTSDYLSKIKGLNDFGSINDTVNDLGKALTGGFGNDNPALDRIADNTDKLVDNTSVDTTDEDLSYMIDLAEREAINRYTMSDVKIEMTNNNNVSSKFDLDDMVDYLQKKMYESMVSNASGVHF